MKNTDLQMFSSGNFTKLLVLFVGLELLNICLMESVLNLLVTIPEVLIVLYCLFIKRDIKKAFLLHILFCLTGFDATSASSELDLISYTEVKLVGPLTLSYIILGLIWLSCLSRKIKCDTSCLLLKFRKVLFIFFVWGTFLGVLGALIYEHRLNDFIIPFIYLLPAILYIDTFLRLYDKDFVKDCYQYALLLVIAAPFATFISYFLLGRRASYGPFDALIYNEEFMMAPMLLLLLFFKVQHKVAIIASLCVYACCVAAAARGGFFLCIFASLLILVILLYSHRDLFTSVYSRVARIIIPIVLFFAITYVGFATSEAGVSLAGNKFNEMISMLQVLTTFNGGGVSLDDMSESPYTRIAEIFNIIDNGREGFQGFLGLVFGKGFGGIYTDSTGMFANVDVSVGAFSEEVARSGRFGTVHSFLPSVLLYNGIIGLIMLFYLGWQYLKRIRMTPLLFAAFVLFFYSFYFNPSIFLATSFALVGAEYKLNSWNNENCIN